jgi:hypothetical protein
MFWGAIMAEIPSESGSAEGRGPLPGTLPGGQVIGVSPKYFFFSFCSRRRRPVLSGYQDTGC